MALVGLADRVLEQGRLRDWIEEYRLGLLIALTAFLIGHSYRNWRKERAEAKIFLKNFDSINNHVLHLIADLAELSGKQYHYWIVDLYVERRVFNLSLVWPFLFGNVLEKKLSIALSGVSEMPAKITNRDKVFGVLAVEDGPMMWWDQELTQTKLSIRNAQSEFTEQANQRLIQKYGVVKVWPITDDLQRKKKGILVVHTKRDPVASTTALGVLAAEQGDRFCARAAHGIHSELCK